MRAGLAAASLLAGTSAGAAAQRPAAEFELRAGVTASTPLVRDEMLARRDRGELGLGERSVSTSGVRVGTAPLVAVVARQPLSEWDALELSAGATFGRLESEYANGWQDVEGLTVLHAAGSWRYVIAEHLAVRAGVGVIRYGATEARVLRDDDKLRPLLEAGAETRVGVAGVRLAIAAFAQAHNFGNVAIREMGGTDGSVVRGGLTVGARFGGGAR